MLEQVLVGEVVNAHRVFAGKSVSARRTTATRGSLNSVDVRGPVKSAGMRCIRCRLDRRAAR
jgi:hypothetical protein